MKKFKVVIKKSPEEMKYGGQSSYGLNLGHRTVYADMPDNPHEHLNKTLQPVPRSQAKIEAEKGETAYGDFNNDGQLEHMNIGGNLHSNGGTPLDVPEGTFIYSNTKKMKIGGQVLSHFGKKAGDKKKYTPAELAKQYDVNKYRAILSDPNADKLAKDTAKTMVANYERKLAELALLQEGMKGFPQGIPKVASPLIEKMQQQRQQQGGGQPDQDMTAAYGGSYGHGGSYPHSEDSTYSGGVTYDMGGFYVPDYSMATGGTIYKEGNSLRDYESTAAYTPGGWAGHPVDLLPVGYGKPTQYAKGGQTNQSLLIKVAQLLQQGVKPDEIYQELLQAKIPQKKAKDIIQTAMEQVGSGQQQGGGAPQGQQQAPDQQQMSPEEQQMMAAQQQMMAQQQQQMGAQPGMAAGGSYIPDLASSAYGVLPQYEYGTGMMENGGDPTNMFKLPRVSPIAPYYSDPNYNVGPYNVDYYNSFVPEYTKTFGPPQVPYRDTRRGDTYDAMDTNLKRRGVPGMQSARIMDFLNHNYNVDGSLKPEEDPIPEYVPETKAEKVAREKHEKELAAKHKKLIEAGMEEYAQGGQSDIQNLYNAGYHLEYLANGGEGCPPGYAWDGDPEDGGGGCVKVSSDTPATTDTTTSSNNIPGMPGTPSSSSNKPVSLGFNIGQDKRFNITGGYNGTLGDKGFKNSKYMAALTFPKLFGKDQGLSLSGNYGAGNLKLGVDTIFPFLGGALGVKGGYTQNLSTPTTAPGSANFMAPSASQSRKGKTSAGVEWNKKVGNTNIKLSGTYGMEEGGPVYSAVTQYPHQQYVPALDWMKNGGQNGVQDLYNAGYHLEYLAQGGPTFSDVTLYPHQAYVPAFDWLADGGSIPDDPNYAYGGMYDMGGSSMNSGMMYRDSQYAIGGESEESVDETTAGPGPRKVPKSEISKYEQQGYARVGNTNTWRKGTSTIQTAPVIKGTAGTPGTAGSSGIRHKGRVTQAWLNASPEQRRAMSARQQQIFEEQHPEAKATPATPAVPGTPDTCPDGYKLNTATGQCEKIIPGQDEITYDELGKSKMSLNKTKGTGWLTPDKWALMAAMAVPPKSHPPFYSNLNARIPIPTFFDPGREQAKASETAAMLARQAGYYSPQGFSNIANYVQANAAGQQADILGKYNTQNVGVANQFAPMQTDIINRLGEYRAKRADNYAMGDAINQQQLENAYRSYYGNIAKVAVPAWYHAAQWNLMNETNPQFNVSNRSGRSTRKKGFDAYGTITSGSSTGNVDYDGMETYAKKLADMKLDPGTQRLIMQNKFPTLRTPGVSNAGAQQWNQMMQNNQNIDAQRGYDMTDLYQ